LAHYVSLTLPASYTAAFTSVSLSLSLLDSLVAINMCAGEIVDDVVSRVGSTVNRAERDEWKFKISAPGVIVSH
jgi:hypothetical protein